MDNKIQEIYNTLQNHFSSNVPNPINYPKCFMYYLQCYAQEIRDKKKFEWAVDLIYEIKDNSNSDSIIIYYAA